MQIQNKYKGFTIQCALKQLKRATADTTNIGSKRMNHSATVTLFHVHGTALNKSRTNQIYFFLFRVLESQSSPS